MIALLLVVIIVVILWQVIPPGDQFVRGFARLLRDPVIHRNALSFFSGRSYVKGQYAGREVALRLQLKRGRHSQGYLVIAIPVGHAASSPHDVLERGARDDGARRAMSAIAAEGLIVSVDEGYLKAVWQPQGLIIFPGRYPEEKWARVLQAMSAVADSLERPRQDVSR